MRDSVGVAAPLRVIAYDADNTPLPNVTAEFFITDTGAAGHLVKSNIVVGDRLGTIRIIGQVAGVQTSPATVLVTVAPTRLAQSGTIDTLTVPFVAGDTTSASTGTTRIAVTLKGKGDTASLGFVVKYELRSAPSTLSGSALPAVILADDAGKASSADTTDGSGASRSVVVRSWLLADEALKAGLKSDSVVVLVSTSYKGVPVGGSPMRVVVPIKVKLTIP